MFAQKQKTYCTNVADPALLETSCKLIFSLYICCLPHLLRPLFLPLLVLLRLMRFWAMWKVDYRVAEFPILGIPFSRRGRMNVSLLATLWYRLDPEQSGIPSLLRPMCRSNGSMCHVECHLYFNGEGCCLRCRSGAERMEVVYGA